MSTASSPQASTRELSGDKAQRIVEAMRASVASRGVSGSTFDNVAREAGVSRGLLHYYFATKERLLVEVVRRDCSMRMELLDSALAAATTLDELIGVLVSSLREFVDEQPEFVAIIFELFTLARRNKEIAVEWAEVLRKTQDSVAAALAAKEAEGIVKLAADPKAVATVLFGLADGLAMRMLSQPDLDVDEAIRAGVLAARALLVDPSV